MGPVIYTVGMPKTPRPSAITGVNLGGWLVLEKWITPGLFAGTKAIDEYTFCEQAGAAEKRRLKAFRDSFITQADFTWLAEQGIQAVRLPVGYWMFGGYPPFAPTVRYVDNVFKWAQDTGMQVLLDLHGAPGSQNGRDHSGQQGRTAWHRQPDAVVQTLQVITKLAERYGDHPALLGFSLLNEPSPRIPKRLLLDYYTQAYRIIRGRCGDKPWIVYSDGYIPIRWRKELPAEQFKNVYIDTHQYRVFTPFDKLLPLGLTLRIASLRLPWSLRRLRHYHPVVVGEWSLALGKRAGPATQNRYAALQLAAYQATDAWFFWTYRTEYGGPWSFRDCVAQFPKRLS